MAVSTAAPEVVETSATIVMVVYLLQTVNSVVHVIADLTKDEQVSMEAL